MPKWANCTLDTQLCRQTMASKPFSFTAICLIAAVRCPLLNLQALCSTFFCVFLTRQLVATASKRRPCGRTIVEVRKLYDKSFLIVVLAEAVEETSHHKLPSHLIFLLRDLKVARLQCFWPNNDQTGLEMLTVPTSLGLFRASLWNTW